MSIRNTNHAVILLLIVPLFISPGPADGQAAPDDGTAVGDILASHLEAYLSFIAADFTRGRETGSEGFDIAAEYVSSLFKTWGIRPGGDLTDPIVRLKTGRERSYFQTVPLIRNVGDPETSMILTVARTGYRQDTVFRRGTEFDVEATVPFDVTAEIVFIGYGSTEPDFNELANLNLRDKIVIRLDGLPGQTNPRGALYKKAQDARQAQIARMMQAAERGEANTATNDNSARRFMKALRDGGAAGCITVALPTAESLASAPPPVDAAWSINAPFRNLASPTFKLYEGDRPPAKRRRLRLSGQLVFAADGRPELFRDASDPIMVTITPQAAAAIFANSGPTLDELQRRIDSSGRPASFHIPDVHLRIRNDVNTEIVNGKNLIGVILGSDPVLKHEVIVVGVHLDHIGAFNSVIFNGADDNASGVAAALELARTFSAESIQPKRTIEGW